MMEDSILYVVLSGAVYRLNLSELWLRRSTPTPRADFEDIVFEGRQLRTFGYDLMIVDSKPYLIGGYLFEKGSRWDSNPIRECSRWGQLTDDPSGSRVNMESAIPRMNTPKFNPMVMTMEGKFYVLSTDQNWVIGRFWSVSFEVFDPVSKLWKVLPNPPLKDCCNIVPRHFTLGHKLVIQNKDNGSYYWFDTRKEKWKHTANMPNAPLLGLVQFKDFLIGIPLQCQHVLIYKLNAYGVPIQCGELVELRKLFISPAINPSAYITLVNDRGLMVLMCADIDKTLRFPFELHVRVALVQVFTTSDDTCIHAHIKATETYSLHAIEEFEISVCLWGDGLKNLDDEKLMMLEKWKICRDDKLARLEEKLKKLGANMFLQVLERLKILGDDKLMRKVEELENLKDNTLMRMVEKYNRLGDPLFKRRLEAMAGLAK